MARNLKGSTPEKQTKDAIIRLNFKGNRKRADGKTYSTPTDTARKTLLNGIAKFASAHGMHDKLNLLLNQKVINAFFDYKIDSEDWDLATAYDRVATLSSLSRGLIEVGIRVNIDKSVFSNLRMKINKLEAFKDSAKNRENRYIPPHDLDKLIKDMHTKGSEYGLYMDIAHTTGLRDAEIRRLMSDASKYLKVNGDIHKIEKLYGKNKKLYDSKIITKELSEKLISNNGDTPEHNALHQTMGKFSPHDVRFTYARNLFDQKMEQGISYKDALLIVSKELNHVRASITKYYLARAIA